MDVVDGLRPHRLLEPVGDEAGGIGTSSTDLDTARVTTDIHTERASGHDTSSQLTCSSVQQLVGWLPKAPSDPRGIAQGASAVDGFRRVSPPRPGSTHAEEVEVTTLQPDEQTEWLDPFKDLYATVGGECVMAASSRTAFTSTPVVDSAVTGFLVPAVPSVPVVFLLLPFRRWSLCPVVLIRALLSNGFLGVTRTSAARRRRRVWSSALMRRAWTPAVGVAWQWRCALAALGIASAHCSRHELASSRTQEWPHRRSRWCAWVRLHRNWHGDRPLEYPVLPLTVHSIAAVMAQLGKGRLRSAADYLPTAKDAHLRRFDWNSQLARQHTLSVRAARRGIGPSKQCHEIDPADFVRGARLSATTPGFLPALSTRRWWRTSSR